MEETLDDAGITGGRVCCCTLSRSATATALLLFSHAMREWSSMLRDGIRKIAEGVDMVLQHGGQRCDRDPHPTERQPERAVQGGLEGDVIFACGPDWSTDFGAGLGDQSLDLLATIVAAVATTSWGALFETRSVTGTMDTAGGARLSYRPLRTLDHGGLR